MFYASGHPLFQTAYTQQLIIILYQSQLQWLGLTWTLELEMTRQVLHH